MKSFAPLLLPLTTIGVELVAVFAALLLFGIFLAVVGAAPIAVFADMLQGAFGSSFSWQNSLSRAAPLMLTALCTALPARMGLVVIGNEGALLLGGLAAAATAMALQGALGPVLLLPVMLIAGAAIGGGWIALSGWLRQARGVNETISSLLLFYIGLGLFLYLVEGPLRDPSSLNKPSTFPIGDAGVWNEGLSSGQGLIAVALVIFARWNPIYCLYASLIYGAAGSLGPALQSIGVQVSAHLLSALPAALTLAIMVATCSPERKLAGAPAELGVSN